MNKKDVLGLQPAAWNVQKNGKSAPIPSSAGNAHFPALESAGNGGKFWRIWYLKIGVAKVKKF